jgi:hypothetical protein
MIASSLSDHDLINFRLVCRSAAAATNDLTFWRPRFLMAFEPPVPEKFYSTYNFRLNYQARRYWMRKGANFKTGTTAAEIECLKVLKDLILG